MKKILAFGASSSRNSINKAFAKYAAAQLTGVEVNFLDLKDFDIPIFCVDKEQDTGYPAPVLQFKEHIAASDGILISFAEHNGSYTAVFKNLLDWTSRVEKSTWMDKPMFLLATSPGGRGGQNALGHAKSRFPFMNGKVVASFSLPSFNKNFDPEAGISDAELNEQFASQLALFKQELS